MTKIILPEECKFYEEDTQIKANAKMAQPSVRTSVETHVLLFKKDWRGPLGGRPWGTDHSIWRKLCKKN